MRKSKRRIAQAQADGKKYILLDAPTLFESGLDKICDRRVSVLASEEVRLQRILVRDKIDEQAARRRMSAQHPDSYYTVRSDFVLRNNGTREELLRDGRSLADELTRPVNQDGRTAIITLVCIISVIAIITGIYQLTFRIVYQRDYPRNGCCFIRTGLVCRKAIILPSHTVGSRKVKLIFPPGWNHCLNMQIKLT